MRSPVDSPAPHDVAVIGGGPAGRALAGACAARGLRTALVDVTPDRPWRITYGDFTADLPADLPEVAVAARARGRAVALQERDLGWEYTVLDVPGLRAHLDAGRVSPSTRAATASRWPGQRLGWRPSRPPTA